jgi:hypothetical protein
MALSGATIRVLDATGKAVATGKPVTAVTGAYGPIALTGGGPYRVEACGILGDKPRCLWSATTSGGSPLQITPLTSSLVVLAGGQSPESLMTGAVVGLTDTALASAQTQLLAALAPALADAGLASDFNLLTGAITPGSHTGADRLLDSVAVNYGQDSKAFVQLRTRFGASVAYLESGSTTGALALDAGATGFDLTGLDALFATMNAATGNSANCQSGLIPVLDAASRASVDTLTFSGPSQTAQLLCLYLGGVVGDGEVLFGGKLLPSELGRCDFPVGGDPICRVNLTFLSAKGVLKPLGIEQAAVKRAAGWRFLGNRLEVQARASARLSLTRRADATAPDTYTRQLDISIPVGGSLQCARVSQKDTGGADVPLAIYKKRGSDALLSLWSLSPTDGTPSLDPATGATRGFVALPVPTGAAGDATARNFVRAGRALKIDLYTDTACTTAMAGADGASISVDLQGQLPLASAAISGQPWPTVAASVGAALTSLKGAAFAKITYGPTWTFSRGGLSMTAAQLCTDADCTAKLADLPMATNGVAAAFAPTLTGTPLNTGDFKQLRLLGRAADGMVLEFNLQSCTSQTVGLTCK